VVGGDDDGLETDVARPLAEGGHYGVGLFLPGCPVQLATRELSREKRDRDQPRLADVDGLGAVLIGMGLL